MRTLFEMDEGNYDPKGTWFVRPSVRGIIRRGDRLALVYSQEYAYYKFPGGGIEAGESQKETLIREVAEETGLRVRPASIAPYGLVRRTDRSAEGGVFRQDNFYYFCDTDPEPGPQRLDPAETEERFVLTYAGPRAALTANRTAEGPEPVRAFHEKYRAMLEREARVLELLLQEGYVS